MAQESTSAASKCFVIVHNISKKHNIGTLLRSCTAFGVTAVCLVGSRHYNTFGSHGSAEHVPLLHFGSLDLCCKHLREQEGCTVLGLEILPAARAVHTHPFTGSTAFMIGNEGQGLSEKQIGLCDGFVYISQYGSGTASLNVTVATSILLHHFALWAGYPEQVRDGSKYVVSDRGTRTQSRGVVKTSVDVAVDDGSQTPDLDGAEDVCSGDLELQLFD